MGEVMMIFFLAVAIFGIFSGVGLLRLKEWARISTLVWSGITIAFCGLMVAVFSVMSFPNQEGTPADYMTIVRIASAMFYSLPLGIGIWWLILFTRKGVVAQFRRSADASADPATSLAEQQLPAVKPAPPLPISVLAVFFLLSSLSLIFVFFFSTPVVLFGHIVRGPAGRLIWVVACLLCAAAGIGLLRLKPWSYLLAIGLQAFWLVSGLVTQLSPNYRAVMEEVMSAARTQFGAPAYPTQSIEQLKVFSWIGLMFPVLIVALLFYYRSRFLTAAAEAQRQG